MKRLLLALALIVTACGTGTSDDSEVGSAPQSTTDTTSEIVSGVGDAQDLPTPSEDGETPANGETPTGGETSTDGENAAEPNAESGDSPEGSDDSDESYLQGSSGDQTASADTTIPSGNAETGDGSLQSLPGSTIVERAPIPATTQPGSPNTNPSTPAPPPTSAPAPDPDPEPDPGPSPDPDPRPTPDPGPTPPNPGAGDYLETFDTRASIDSLDFYIANGRNYFNRPTQWPGDHAAGGDCGKPTTTRTVNWPDPQGDETPVRYTDPGEAAYWCAPAGPGSGHMMTTFHTGGYAHFDFSPKQVFSDVRRVCWSANATNLGNRKWHQILVVDNDLAEAVAPRLDWTHPEFRGEGGPANWGLEVTDGVFMFSAVQGGAQVMTGTQSNDSSFGNDLSVSDKIKRVRTCLIDQRNGKIRVEQERWSGGTAVSELTGAFPRGDVRVVWQDVSYDPDKAHTESPPKVSDVYTWHWDDLFVSSKP